MAATLSPESINEAAQSLFEAETSRQAIKPLVDSYPGTHR